mmetsp:Transcript_7806/g.10121  ORF Transcript_7806/g.10121 Transcript_7806/m.10121 type:complete len:156 (+) Transcript_7806:71-538(+)
MIIKLNNNKILFQFGKNNKNNPIPKGDSKINWLINPSSSSSKNHGDENEEEYEKELEPYENDGNHTMMMAVHGYPMSRSDIGISILKDDYLFFHVVAEKPTEHNNGPLGLSLFFTFDDGTDTLYTMYDLFSSKPITLNDDEVDSDYLKPYNQNLS